MGLVSEKMKKTRTKISELSVQVLVRAVARVVADVIDNIMFG